MALSERLRPIRCALETRSAPAWIVALALLLTAPALSGSFAADDHLHQLLLGEGAALQGFEPRPWSLFSFATGDPELTAARREAGVFPWWVTPDVRLAFFRPLSNATHVVDHALAPSEPVVALVHNLLWFALGIWLLGRVYRRLLGSRSALASFALLLYAVDDARGPVVGWIANRNALIAFALSLLAFEAFVASRGRVGGKAPASVALFIGPFVFACALLAGEAAVALLGWIVAYAVALDPRPWKERVLAVAPYLAVVVAWRVVYRALGYGVAGSGIYIDPAASPGRFVALAAERIPVLFVGQLAFPWSDLANALEYLPTSIATALLVVVLVIAGALLVAALPAMRSDRHARFFALSFLLALVPVAATFPADRLLIFAGVGGMGLVAVVIGRGLRPGAGRVAFVVAILAGFFHLGLSPVMLLARSRSMVTVQSVIERGESSLPAEASPGETWVLVNPPADPLAGYLPLTRASLGGPLPGRFRWLAHGSVALQVDRVDQETLRLRAEEGLLKHQAERMLRDPVVAPFAPGDAVALEGLTLEVTEVTRDGRPRTVAARFDAPLEAIRFFVWDDGYVPWEPPPVGGRVALEAVDVFHAMRPPE